MQINIEKNLVEFTPENAEESAKIQALWRTLVDCARFNKKMVPVGEYLPGAGAFARFAIEGMDTKAASDFPDVRVEKDCRCLCQTCNKYVMLKKGDRIPPCCGKLMEVMD